jgi:hypothetical protein
MGKIRKDKSLLGMRIKEKENSERKKMRIRK